MKKIIYLIVFSAVTFFSCKKNNDESVVACFSVDKTETTDSTHAFLFDQCPPAYDLSYWDFNDGQYSSNPNPSHVFNHSGTYHVKLTVTNAGQSNSVTHTITIGHYSIDKIIYKQTSTFVFRPTFLQFGDSIGTWYLRDTVSVTSSLPLTHQLSDNSVYDLISQPAIYQYTESDTASHLLWKYFHISTSQIINKQTDIALDCTPNDTAKFTIYFKIVP